MVPSHTKRYGKVFLQFDLVFLIIYNIKMCMKILIKNVKCQTPLKGCLAGARSVNGEEEKVKGKHSPYIRDFIYGKWKIQYYQ